ncbi:MAG: hypothetical protein G5701_01790 [Serratia symbiotica]|nr:hypothetical protein [Serratia symbiotica]
MTLTRLLVQRPPGGVSLFHLSATFFRAGTEHHPAPLFQLRTQMRDVPLLLAFKRHLQ